MLVVPFERALLVGYLCLCRRSIWLSALLAGLIDSLCVNTVASIIGCLPGVRKLLGLLGTGAPSEQVNK